MKDSSPSRVPKVSQVVFLLLCLLMLPLQPTEALSTKQVQTSTKFSPSLPKAFSSNVVQAKKIRERDPIMPKSLVYLTHVHAETKSWAALAPHIREAPQEVRVQCDRLVTPYHFEHVARYFCDQIADWFVDDQQIQEQRYQTILTSLSSFSRYCHQTLHHPQIAGFKLRASAAYGSKATGCPAWHADSVPVRAIQTLHGPGTLVMDPLTVGDDNPYLKRILEPTRSRSEHITRETNAVEWKDRLVHESGIAPTQVPTGTLAVLAGHTWKEAAAPTVAHAALSPVLHKSPSTILDDQGRVLLVLDVVLAESSSTCTDGCCK